MDEVFTTFLCKDYLTYDYTEKLCCIVADDEHPTFEYSDSSWENIVKKKLTESETPRSRRKKTDHIAKKTRRKLFKARGRKRKANRASVISSPSSADTNAQKSSSHKRKPSPLTSNPKSQCTAKTRRRLFEVFTRKRKQASPLQSSSVKRKPSATPSATTSTVRLEWSTLCNALSHSTTTARLKYCTINNIIAYFIVADTPSQCHFSRAINFEQFTVISQCVLFELS